jgi:hypothetical protein
MNHSVIIRERSIPSVGRGPLVLNLVVDPVRSGIVDVMFVTAEIEQLVVWLVLRFERNSATSKFHPKI